MSPLERHATVQTEASDQHEALWDRTPVHSPETAGTTIVCSHSPSAAEGLSQKAACLVR